MEGLETLLLTAKAAGCPQEQVETFIKARYIPYPWQFRFHGMARRADMKGGPTKIGLGGARGPGKSHAIFAQITLDDCQRVNNLKGLFLRQTAKASKESLEDLVNKVLARKVEYEFSSSVIKFAKTGSRVVMGGFKDEKDIDKYIGIEYDFIAIEEINQLSENKVKMLLGSMRTTKEDWRPRLYASFNPGGVGHTNVKKLFVIPYKTHHEQDSAFIPATWRDNPGLNEDYINYLYSLTGQLGQAWREGDFDIMAGTFFPEWDEKVHVVKPFDIPRDWRRIGMMDYGHTAPTALYWGAIAPDGTLYIYRELYCVGLTFSKLADEFVSMTPAWELHLIEYIVADPSIWAKKGENENGFSGYEVFSQRFKELTKKSIQMNRANNDRKNGWNAVREYLTPFMENGKKRAKLQVFDNCKDLIRTMPEQIHSEIDPEDLNTDMEDHAQDSVRYGIMSKPSPKVIEQQSDDTERPQYPDIGV